MATPSAGPQSKWTDLGVRALSAIVLIPAAVAVVLMGGIWFNLVVALLCALMAHEWVSMAHRRDSLQFVLHAAAALCGALLPAEAGIIAALAAIAAIWSIQASISFVQEPHGTFWRYLGVPYVSLPAIALVTLRSDQVYGADAIIWVMVTVWSADTLAYFAGRTIGGPRLAPVLSPKKTWAGLGGAIAGSAIASFAFAHAAGLAGIAVLTLLAGLLAIVEQAGDLFKSALKRHYGVKDSGQLIPGHGGVIDRVDGLVAVATAAALIGYWRSGLEATGMGLLSW